jgi:hypothetical protein
MYPQNPCSDETTEPPFVTRTNCPVTRGMQCCSLTHTHASQQTFLRLLHPAQWLRKDNLFSSKAHHLSSTRQHRPVDYLYVLSFGPILPPKPRKHGCLTAPKYCTGVSRLHSSINPKRYLFMYHRWVLQRSPRHRRLETPRSRSTRKCLGGTGRNAGTSIPTGRI